MAGRTTLVLGGNGKTGRRVVDRLVRRGVPVRSTSRSSDPPFDWEQPATWTDALRGVGAMYITYYPDLAAPGAPSAIDALTHRALENGVRRLVLLSGRGEHEAERCEEIVRNSGAEWTIVRASWFAQNFSENYLLEAVLAGEVALPVGEVGEPFIDADDIADVAAAALTDDRHLGQLYEVTGPELWTFRDAVAEIAAATKRSIRYVQVSTDVYAAMLREAQLPPDLAALILYLFTDVLDGRNASTTDGVMRALGRPPRGFSDYVRETAATGVWNAP
jgi:uncharacterized protein YbjT (DUF2867 family)